VANIPECAGENAIADMIPADGKHKGTLMNIGASKR